MGSHKSFSRVRAPQPQPRAETQTSPGYLHPSARQHTGTESHAEKHSQTHTRPARPAQSKLALRHGLGFLFVFLFKKYVLTLLSPVPLAFGCGYRCSTRMGVRVCRKNEAAETNSACKEQVGVEWRKFCRLESAKK